MKEILATSTKRHLKILEYLFYQYSWSTTQGVAKELNCSSRILNSDIQFINERYAPFVIETSVKNGIRLRHPDNVSADLIYKKVYNNSPEFLLIEALFFEQHKTVDSLLSTIHVSLSTFTRMVSRLKPLLAKEEITIESSPYMLKGDELRLRNFFVHYFLEKYALDQWPCSPLQLKAVEEITERVTKSLEDPLDYADRNRLHSIILVNLIRMSNGHFGRKEYPQTDKDYLFDRMVNNVVWQQTFYKEFNVVLTTNVLKEIFYIFLPENFSKHTSSKSNKLFEEEVLFHISSFLEHLSTLLDVPLKNKQALSRELFNLQNLFFGQNFILYDKKKHFIEQIKFEFPKLHHEIHKELLQFKFYTDFNWKAASFNEVFYTILTRWQNLQRELENKIIPSTIGILCDFDKEYSNLLKENIYYHLGHTVQIEEFKSTIREEIIKESAYYDIVVTNISEVPFKSPHIVCISAMLTSHNWASIRKIVNKLSHERNLIAIRR